MGGGQSAAQGMTRTGPRTQELKKKSTFPKGSAARRASQHSDMRRKNESAVLSLVRRFGGLSSADISRRSGLAPQTVSVLLKRLERHGIVMRGQVLRGRRGQPAVPILINPDGGFGIGVELSWRHIDVVLINLVGDVLARNRLDIGYPDASRLIRDILAGVKRVLKALPPTKAKKVLGLGLAMPGQMHAHLDDLGADAEAAAALRDLDLVGELSAGLSFPIFVVNDGTAACRAECAFGRGADHGDMLYIFLGTFVGSGIFVDGRVIEGRSGDAANVGAYKVAGGDEGRTLHDVASIWGIETHMQALGKCLSCTPPAEWDWPALEPDIQLWLRDAAEGLALAIANSCSVIDFSTTIIDGIMPEPVLSRLVSLTQIRTNKLLDDCFEPPLIIQGSVGASAPAIGAANLPIYLAFFSQEQVV
jgi:predicted NBD/HSP70 family sugar kinase